MARLRDAGKEALALSNSGKRANDNEQRLAALGLPPEAYDGVLSSGEVAWSGLHAQEHEPFIGRGDTVFLITRGDDRSIVKGLSLRLVKDVQDSTLSCSAGSTTLCPNLNTGANA